MSLAESFKHVLGDLRAADLVLHHVTVPEPGWPEGFPRCDLRYGRNATQTVAWGYDPHRHKLVPFVVTP